MYLSKYKIRRSTPQKLVHSTCVVAHLACQFLVRGVQNPKILGHISFSRTKSIAYIIMWLIRICYFSHKWQTLLYGGGSSNIM